MRRPSAAVSERIEEALFAAQTINEDVAQPPEHQKQHEHDATKKAEVAVMPPMRLIDTTRLSKTMSAVRQLDEANKESVEQHKESKEQQKELKKHHEELKEQVIEMKQQQDDAIKKAVENAIAVQLPEAVEQAVAKQLPMEVKKVVAEQLPKEVKKVQEAIEKKADEAVQGSITKNDTAFKHMKA